MNIVKKYLISLLKFELGIFAFAIRPTILVICFAVFAVTYLPEDIWLKAIGLFILVTFIASVIIERKF